MRNRTTWNLTSFAVAVLIAAPALAQEGLKGLPEASQEASVHQRIGVTDIDIDYHRPGVKGRTVWGDLVPYGQVWRAGANENTVVRFSHPVQVEGQTVAAGSYGLHMIPTAGEWTVILSHNSTSWGSFFYKPEEDAVRATVKPEPAPHQEWLSYSIDEPGAAGAVIALRWEKLRVPIRVDVDTKAHTLTAIHQQLRSSPGFGWRGRSEAAAWCAENGVNLDEAMTWIDRSIAGHETAANLAVKVALLERKGDTAAAKALFQKIVEVGTESEINLLAYQYLGDGKKERAVELFELNAKRHPRSWNVHDSLGEAYAQSGKKDLALASYRKAHEMATDPKDKERIAGVLTRLEKR